MVYIDMLTLLLIRLCCVAEAYLFRKPPSLIASACVLAAARGLKVPGASADSVCALTLCPLQEVQDAVILIDSLVDSQAGTHAAPRPPPTATTTSKHTPATDEDPRYPETPTDVQEIFF